MSDEAVVRIVLTDGAGGSAQSAATTSTQMSGMGSDRLFREMSRGTLDITSSLKKHLDPVAKKLDTIIDLLGESINWDIKDYQQEDVSTGKMIGAFTRGWQAVQDELRKLAGLDSPERQIVASNREIVNAINYLNANLNPEEKQKNIVKDAISGALVTTGFIGLLKGMEHWSKITSIAGGAYGAAQGTSAAVGAASSDISGAGLGAEVGGALGSNFEMIGGAALIAAGAAAAALAGYLSPKEKEKSTNELLADISANTKSTEDINRDISKNTETAAADTREIYEVTSQILDQLVPTAKQVTTDPLANMTNIAPNVDANAAMLAGMALDPNKKMLEGMSQGNYPRVHDPADQDLERHRKEWEALQVKGGYANDDPDYAPARHGGPNWPGEAQTAPISDEEFKAQLEEATGPYTAPEPPDPWNEWNSAPEAYRPGHLLNKFQKEYLEKSKWPGYKGQIQLSGPEVGEFRSYLMSSGKDKGLSPPIGLFAKGGMAGSDTIPALLTPGEVVIPKGMVDGGAVDHLRGQLPGFAGGGMVGMAKAGLGAAGTAWTAKNQFATTAASDTGGSISQIGGGISAVGDQLSAAVPMIGGFVKGLGAGVEAFGGLVKAINEVAERYGEYSSEIASAQAVAEIRQAMGDFRRAQEISADMADFIHEQSEMQQKFEDLKIKLLMQIVPAITRILEIMDMGVDLGPITSALDNLLDPVAALASAGAEMVNMNRDKGLPDVEDPAAMLRNRNFDSKGGDWVPNR